MRLNDYLFEKKLTQRAFAKLVGVEQATVCRYVGGRVPAAAIVMRIERVTHGKVTGEDLVPERDWKIPIRRKRKKISKNGHN